MKPYKNYDESLYKSLANPQSAAAYINAALEENDMETLLLALRDVAESMGFSNISKRSKLRRESLYKMLSRNGNPELRSILTLFKATGLKLSVKAAA